MAAPAPRASLARRWQALRSSRRLARLNHIFIPPTKADRDRYRNGRLGRVLRPLLAGSEAYTREGRALLLITVLVGCAGIDARLTQTHQLFAMLVALLFVSLVTRPLFRTPGLRVTIAAPERVMAGAAARFDLRLVNDGPRAHHNLHVEHPFLPWDGQWGAPVRGLARLGQGERASLAASATFVARGEHHLDSFAVGARVPLGLALGQRTTADVPRFLVVPRIANVVALRSSHRVPERRGATVASRRAGQHDLAGVRPYRAGDPLKHLHARTWARTGVPHVRTYVDERQDRVALVVVVDGGEASERAKEATLSLAAGIAARLALHEGGIDEIVVDDAAFAVEPRSGERALDRVLDRLGVHELTTEIRDASETIAAFLPRFSTLILVTAGVARRHREVVALARRRGIPCRWAAVSEGERPSVAAGEVEWVDVEHIEGGRVIAL